MTRLVKRYNKEFIKEALVLARNSPSITSAAKELGIPEATLHTWLSTAKKAGDVPTPSGELVNVSNVIFRKYFT